MKVLKLFMIFIMLLTVNVVYPQSITFKKVYPSSVSVAPNQFNVVCKPINNDNNFLINTPGIKIIKINKTGEILALRCYLNFGAFSHFIISNDNSKYLFFSNSTLNNVFDKKLLQLDTSLNFILEKQYDSVNFSYYSIDRNVILSVDHNEFLLCANKDNLYTPAILKIDSIGDIIWSRYFALIQGGIQDIIQTQDSGFVIAANLINLGSSLIKTDYGGNVLWAKSYFRPRGFVHNVLENADGTLIITGNTDSLTLFGSEYNSSPLFFVKLDNTGNVIWAKTFGDNVNRIRNYLSCTKQTQDGGYISLATLANNEWADDLLLIKTDAIGDTLWVRAHGSPQSFDIGQSIEQLNDKGYIISGITNNNIPVTLSSLYFVRTDSLGHTDSLCEEYSPTIAINNISINDSDITVTSVPFTITTSVPDTSTQSFTTYAYDGCHLDAIPELYAEQTSPLLIFPNPNDGKFQITSPKFQNTNSKIQDSSIEIFNVLGEKVYSGYTDESKTSIDLTGNAKGLYFVRMSNERWLKTGKVMVE